MLIGYDRSPTVCCLEYEEQRDLLRNPGKEKYYAELIEKRTKNKQKRKHKKKRK